MLVWEGARFIQENHIFFKKVDCYRKTMKVKFRFQNSQLSVKKEYIGLIISIV